MNRSEADRIIDLLREDLADWKREVRSDFVEVKATLASVEAEAKKTNGRLRRLEMWRHGLEAVAKARAWVRPALIGLMSGAALAVLGAILAKL